MTIAKARVAFLLVAAAASLFACSAPTAEEEVGGTASSVTTASWTLPADVRAAGAKVKIAYEGEAAWKGKSGCSGALKAGSKVLAEFLDDKYVPITSIGGYACRPNTANTSKMSVHGSGRALDIMLPTKGGAADSAKGDPIANWLVMNATKVGVQLIIWNRTVWRANGTNTGRYTGPVPHIDHIHVELTSKGATQQTVWFADQGVTSEPAPETDTPAPEQAELPPSDPQDPPVLPAEEEPLPDDEPAPPEEEPAPPPQTPAAEAPPPENRADRLPQAQDAKVEELGDGPGEAESQEKVTSKASKVESSGCGVTPSTGHADGSWLAVALALAAVLRGRRRSIGS